MATKLPKKLALDYYKDMLKRIRMMEKLTQQAFNDRIAPLLLKYEYELAKEAAVELKTNARILGGLSARLKQLHELTLAQISGEFTSISLEVKKLFNVEFSTGIAKKFVDRVNVTDKKNTNQAITQVVGKKNATKLKGINLLEDQGIQTMVKSSVNKNVSLIQSIPQKYIAQVEQAVYGGLESGASIKTLGQDIADIGKVSERRGQFIARDQLGTVYGDLTKKRQENLGLKRFKWLTSHDERVRDSHKALDGKVFEWDKGAQGPGVDPDVEGLVPGEDYNCRCTSTVVDDDIWGLLDRLESE